MKIYESPAVSVLSLSDEDILTSSDNFKEDIFLD